MINSNVVHNSKLNVGMIDSNFHSEDSNFRFTTTQKLQYVSVSFKVPGHLGLDWEKVCCTVLFYLGEELHRQLSRSAGQGMRTLTKCGTRSFVFKIFVFL